MKGGGRYVKHLLRLPHILQTKFTQYLSEEIGDDNNLDSLKATLFPSKSVFHRPISEKVNGLRTLRSGATVRPDGQRQVARDALVALSDSFPRWPRSFDPSSTHTPCTARQQQSATDNYTQIIQKTFLLFLLNKRSIRIKKRKQRRSQSRETEQ